MSGGNQVGADGEANAAFIAAETAWFRQLLETRLKMHARGETGGNLVAISPPPPLGDHAGPYADCVRDLELGAPERLLLILAVLPHTAPFVLDPFFIQNNALGRPFTEFGGIPGPAQGSFVPSGETAMFLLTGHDLGQRLKYGDLLGHRHILFTHNVLENTGGQGIGDTPLSLPLRLSPEFRERLLHGRDYDPPLSGEFPAQRLRTALDWDDLVLDAETREDVRDIATWVEHGETLLEDWGLRRRLTPGYRSLFYGPPGTGKTLTATLLGKATGLPVYRIDLSKVISKYIGETEKNLASLFDRAQHQRWILFFDEADALFGKRTDASTSNDRHANQQISYLLQRIEDFPGVVILASNLQSLMDAAFTRRFQSIIHFRMPDAEQRLRMWRDQFAGKPFRLADDVDLVSVAQGFELSGAGIVNVLRYACLKAVTRDPQDVRMDDILRGIRRERHKDGKFT